jgi:hypothetical protein
MLDVTLPNERHNLFAENPQGEERNTSWSPEDVVQDEEDYVFSSQQALGVYAVQPFVGATIIPFGWMTACMGGLTWRQVA